MKMHEQLHCTCGHAASHADVVHACPGTPRLWACLSDRRIPRQSKRRTGEGSSASEGLMPMLLCNHASAGQLQLRHRIHSGSFASTSLPRTHPSGQSREESAWGNGYQRHICRQPRSNGSSTDSLTAMEVEQPHGQGFNGGPSPSAVFETARMQVPLFQALSEKEGQQTEGISVEHIPGFASVGSNIYEVFSLHKSATTSSCARHAVGSTGQAALPVHDHARMLTCSGQPVHGAFQI